MNLAQQLKEIAKSSAEERLKLNGTKCADYLRDKARFFALRGATCFQLDDINHYGWSLEEFKFAIELLTQDGFYCVISERAVGVSWGNA